jgi:hypothetical protein
MSPVSLRRSALVAAAALAAASSLASSASAKPGAGPSAISPCSSHLASGSGDTYIGFCVGPRGNLVSLESSPAVNHLGPEGGEGYVICDDSGLHGFDVDTYGSSGLGPATVAQPGGPNTLPLTVNRTTTDGIFKLTQKYAFDLASRGVKVTMVLKNITGATRTGVEIFRQADLDVGGGSSDDSFAMTRRAIFAFQANSTSDDGVVVEGVGPITAASYLSTFAVWNGGLKSTCVPSTLAGPTATGDYVATAGFALSTLLPGNAQTANVRYSIR